MFGEVAGHKENQHLLITEDFPFNPMSPYAVSKISSFYMIRFYRKVYNMYICTAISFNHESPLRHEEFITRKITWAAARIKFGL